MGASGMGGGGKRGVNTDLNLVPFIDLLSTLICFLLMTAVWQQLSTLQTNTGATTSNESATPQEKKVDLGVTLLLDRVEASEDSRITKIPLIQGEVDVPRLTQILLDWKTRFPKRNDLILYSDSQAPYKNLIRLMDTMVENHFDDVGVNTN